MTMRAQRKLVSFIGIGSESAAPLLYSYIKLHPGVCVAEESTNFFSDTKVYAQGIDWYEQQFKKMSPGLLCGDLSYRYLRNVSSLPLITRTYPSAKLVAVVESPLVSVRVAYVEARRARSISQSVSLAMFLKQNPEVLAAAKYGRQLAEYFSYYSPTDLFVTTAADVRDEPLSVIKSVYEHIGADPTFVPTILKHLIPDDEDEPKRRPGIIKRSYRAIKRLIAKTYQYISKKINPPVVLEETASMVARQIPLSSELEQFLKEYYRKDIAMLSHLMHRSLTDEWGFDKK